MVSTDLLEEMRARLVAAQRVMNIDSPDEIRQKSDVPRRSTMVTGIHQGRRGLAESVDRWRRRLTVSTARHE
jgi:hypothetical protein